MSYVITAVLFTVIGFVAGALFFRKNKAKLEKAEIDIREALK